MKKSIVDSLLLEYYGGLLTEKQQQIMSIYVDYDVSLSEIASEMGMTRQAVYDAVKKSEAQLKQFEDALGCVNKYLNDRLIIEECIAEIDKLQHNLNTQKLQNLKEKLKKLL